LYFLDWQERPIKVWNIARRSGWSVQAFTLDPRYTLSFGRAIPLPETRMVTAADYSDRTQPGNHDVKIPGVPMIEQSSRDPYARIWVTYYLSVIDMNTGITEPILGFRGRISGSEDRSRSQQTIAVFNNGRSVATLFDGKLYILEERKKQPPVRQTDYSQFKARLQHVSERTRVAAVDELIEVLLTELVSDMGSPLSNAPEVLGEMRASELEKLFTHLREYWQDWKFVGTGFGRGWSTPSPYEQLHRFIRVLRKIDGLNTFAFERYVLTKEETISRLALFGMALVYSDKYRIQLEQLAAGDSELKQAAGDALNFAGRRT
jgi:hypothetical protein